MGQTPINGLHHTKDNLWSQQPLWKKYEWMGYYWRPGLPEDRLMDPPFFPMVNNWPYPYGTKGSWVSPEAALRHKWFGNFAGKMREYASERNAHMIGEGVVAPPPCTPQPICQLLEGSAPPAAALCAPPPGAGRVAAAGSRRPTARGRAHSAFLS